MALPASPYHLALPLRRPLQIILLQVDRQWPSGELALHQCAGYILNVDLKITPVPTDGKQTLRLAKQGSRDNRTRESARVLRPRPSLPARHSLCR